MVLGPQIGVFDAQRRADLGKGGLTESLQLRNRHEFQEKTFAADG
jgi:hypothetical protein